MVNINWAEFKEYKLHSSKDDNFTILLDFLKSYYNMISPNDIYDSLAADGTAKMMLDKRDITDAEELETYLYNQVNG